MQLLDPQSVKSARLASEDSDLARLAHMRAYIEKEEALLKDRRSIVEAERDRLENEFETFTSQHFSKISTLKKEIGELEERREDALRPIDEQKEEARRLFDEAIKATIEVSDREAKILLKIGQVEEKEKSLNQFAEELSSRESRLVIVEADNQKETRSISTERQILENDKSIFHTKVQDVEKEYEDKMRIITERQSQLKAKEDYIESEKERIRIKEIRLVDREQTLEREYERLKNKTNG